MPIATSPTPITFDVPSLGALHGWTYPEDGTTQFFGVPYASISARFRNSVPLEAWEGNEWDGKRLGGYSAQPDRPFYPFPMPARPHLNESLIDELNCCNLQITLPPGCTPSSKLPVLVFIHGGGFVFGTANYSILDGRPLANRSAEEGLPIIIVTMNYRVGMYGFLASSDIKADMAAHGGGNGNQGIVDQKNALIWINKHIGSLGGDPNRVLLTGQSAGAVSVDLHLRAPHNNLFSTAVLQSGTVPICGIYSEEEYDVVYMKLLGACGVDVTLTSAERLEALRQVPHDVVSQQTYEVFQDLNLPQFGPCRDGFLLGKDVEVPGPSWYRAGTIESTGFKGRVVLGDCMHEGIIYDQAFRDYSVDYVLDKIKHHLPADLAEATISHYKIAPAMSKRDLYLALEAIVTDGLFTAPPFLMAEASPECFVYHWDHRSQFKNPWGGFAHHSLDYMWLFGGLSAILTEDERAMASRLQLDWISFANGIEPYPSYGAAKRCRVYGPDSRLHLEDGSTYSSRPTEWFERIRNDLDAFDSLCTDIILRRPELMSYEFGPQTANRRKVTQGAPLMV